MTEVVYILLPVHNRREITRNFVQCLSSQTHQNFHLVLIDDGCCDGTATMVQEYIEKITIIQGNGSWWWAGSLQQGINWLNTSTTVKKDATVLIMNDDISFANNFLEVALEIFSKSNKTLLLPQSLNKKKRITVETGVYANLTSMIFQVATSPNEINCLSTRGLLIRLNDINEIGGFRPLLLPHYWSDYEFTIRAFKKGFDLKTTPKIAIEINESETGIREVINYNFLSLKDIFSKKSILNPIYSSIFILLTCPIPWVAINLIRIWKRTILLLIRMLVSKIFHKLKFRLTDI